MKTVKSDKLNIILADSGQRLENKHWNLNADKLIHTFVVCVDPSYYHLKEVDFLIGDLSSPKIY